MPIDDLADESVDLQLFKSSDYYKVDDIPVFFGHYWRSETPSVYRKNICCLDFSVADNGHLAAYRQDGENSLNNENICFV